MVCRNCSALVDSLVESELFGYVRGAFTGATQDKSDYSSTPTAVQSSSMRLGNFPLLHRPNCCGSCRTAKFNAWEADPQDIDVRVVAATHRNLKAMVRDGQFREDLYSPFWL